jgi:hypothetical protein
MLRKPAVQKNVQRRTESFAATKPAPVRGWNALDPVTAVREDEAIILDNWFPRQSNLETRAGSASHKINFADSVYTVMPYHGLTGSKLFACTDTGIWDATSSGSIGAASIALTHGKVQHINFAVQGGNYLACVNGVDSLKLYNGTAWQSVTAVSAPIAITGLVTSTFIHINSYKSRMFFVIKDTLSFAYLPPAVLGGVAVEYPLQGVFAKGGYLMAMGTWTVDAGNGVDDHAVFLTSEGEIAIYTGSDPGDADNWNLVGVYALGRPLSRKCMCKYGGELLLVLRDGIYPISVAMLSATVDRTKAITNKVDNAWQDSAKRYGERFGWCAYVFKEAPFLLCNIPNTNVTNSVQYIMNTTTRAWTRFTGIGGEDFAVMNNRLFLARGREVCEMWVGTSDYNLPIQYRAKTGFSNFGYAGLIKHWTTIRPVIEFNGQQGLQVGLDVDFEDSALSGSVNVSTNLAAIWDLDLWDTGLWGVDYYLSQAWITVASNPGYYAATKVQHASTLYTGKWFVTNYIYETGGLV